jgi:hypothetical protein
MNKKFFEELKRHLHGAIKHGELKVQHLKGILKVVEKEQENNKSRFI